MRLLAFVIWLIGWPFLIVSNPELNSATDHLEPAMFFLAMWVGIAVVLFKKA